MIIESNIPFLEKIIRILNEKYPSDAPFVCLGLGNSFGNIFNILSGEEGHTPVFTGVSVLSKDIKRVSAGGYDPRYELIMDYWMRSYSGAYYFAPMDSRIAKENPNALTDRIKQKVNIIKIVL